MNAEKIIYKFRHFYLAEDCVILLYKIYNLKYVFNHDFNTFVFCNHLDRVIINHTQCSIVRCEIENLSITGLLLLLDELTKGNENTNLKCELKRELYRI